ncbi:MAG: sugar-binding transcriptional regulator [Clostridium thermopalmarium]|nr:sugar-binding transcriptional regulator [Clostridium thermopalmarium]
MLFLKYLEIEKRVVPEVLELLDKRYNILTTIYYNQPIGRRMLASHLGIGERIVRSEIGFLKKQGLIDINAEGMTVNYDGKKILEALKEFVHDLRGLSEMEEYLKEKLKLRKVIVVPGDIDENELTLEELGKTAANFIKSILKDKNIIALTGGKSIKKMVDNMPKTNEYKDILIIPARGGIGRNVEIQANTLVARLAERLSADYKMLQLIDNVDYAEIFAILNEESIKEVVENIHKANILIYGIGKAEDMAKKRGLKDEAIDELRQKKAVGEAFGCYFNINGEVIFSTPTAGIKGEDTKKIENIIAISGGRSKAKAILGVQRFNSNNILITDEGAAKEIINIIKSECQ